MNSVRVTTHGLEVHSTLSRSLLRGFSLVELMVVLVIVGILATIGLPAYDEYVTRSRLTEAYSGLTTWQANAEQFWSDNRTYVGFNIPATVSSSNFGFGASNQSASAYLLTATGTGTMAGFGFTIDQANARVTTGVKAGWTAPATNCWTNDKSGTCLK